MMDLITQLVYGLMGLVLVVVGRWVYRARVIRRKGLL